MLCAFVCMNLNHLLAAFHERAMSLIHSTLRSRRVPAEHTLCSIAGIVLKAIFRVLCVTWLANSGDARALLGRLLQGCRGALSRCYAECATPPRRGGASLSHSSPPTAFWRVATMKKKPEQDNMRVREVLKFMEKNPGVSQRAIAQMFKAGGPTLDDGRQDNDEPCAYCAAHMRLSPGEEQQL